MIENKGNNTRVAIQNWLIANDATDERAIKKAIWDLLARCRSRQAIASELGFDYKNPAAWDIFYEWIEDVTKYAYDKESKKLIKIGDIENA